MTPNIINDLAERGLLSQSWLNGAKPLWRERANAHLGDGSGHWWEPDVTRFLGLMDGDLERAVIAFFCAALGIQAKTTYRLMTGNDFRRRVPRDGRLRSWKGENREVDLVVAETLDDQETWRPVIAVEAKFSAAVNGGVGYCKNPAHTTRYASQLTCYTNGCTHDRLSAGGDAGVRFVWLGPTAADDVLDVADTYKRTPGVPDGDMGEYYVASEAAAKHWTVVSWNDLQQAIEGKLAAKHGAVIQAIRHGLTWKAKTSR